MDTRNNSLIDETHDWTHEPEFEQVVTNRRAREMACEAADLLQYLQYCHSAQHGAVIQPFDASEIRRHLRAVESYLPSEE